MDLEKIIQSRAALAVDNLSCANQIKLTDQQRNTAILNVVGQMKRLFEDFVGNEFSLTNEEVKGKTIYQAAALVLRKTDRPMRTSEIVRALRSTVIGQRVKKLHNSVYTAINRKKEIFEKVGPGLWILKAGRLS